MTGRGTQETESGRQEMYKTKAAEKRGAIFDSRNSNNNTNNSTCTVSAVCGILCKLLLYALTN